MNGAHSQDVVNLFYSILSFLNEAQSYMIGHLYLGIDAKWLFNTNTTACESRQTNYFRVGRCAGKKTTILQSLFLFKNTKQRG